MAADAWRTMRSGYRDTPLPRARRIRGSRSAFARLFAALPNAVLFAPFFSVAICAIVALSLLHRDGMLTPRSWTVIASFTAGSALGGLLAWLGAAFIAGCRPWSARLSAMLILLTVGTPGGVALVSLLQFRLYFAAHHEGAAVAEWMSQLVMTSASITYILVVSGLPLLLPLGLVPLVGGALMFAGRRRG